VLTGPFDRCTNVPLDICRFQTAHAEGGSRKPFTALKGITAFQDIVLPTEQIQLSNRFSFTTRFSYVVLLEHGWVIFEGVATWGHALMLGPGCGRPGNVVLKAI